MKVSVCIDMMFAELDFYDRIAAVRECGINTVEFWRWSNKEIDKIAESGIDVSVFSVDSSDERISEDLLRGILNDGKDEDFLKAVEDSIPIYKQLNANAMIALIGAGKPYNAENVYKCLARVRPRLEEEDIRLVIEPLNATDRKGYAMPYAAPVYELIKELDTPNIRMLYDIYHQNMTGDFSIDDIVENIDLIGHFHVADCPGRHEPTTGSVDYVSIIREINKTAYRGYIGLEYRATKPDSKTLDFLREAEENA